MKPGRMYIRDKLFNLYKRGFNQSIANMNTEP